MGILTARTGGQDGVQQRSLPALGLQIGGFIALVRLGVFWSGLALYTGHGDWRQVAGYALLILNSAPELALAAAGSGKHPGPTLLVAGLIVLSSAFLGLIVAAVVWRARNRTKAAW